MRSWTSRVALGVVSSLVLATTGFGGHQLGRSLEAIADAATVASTVAASPVTAPTPPAATPEWRHLGRRASQTEDAGFGTRAATSVRRTAHGYIKTRVGCLADSSARTMHRQFRDRIGPLIGWDNPHVISLGRNRHLWLVHDSYMDYLFTATKLSHARPPIQNLAMIQKGRCFTLVHRGTTSLALNFEPGKEASPPDTYFWPLGGGLHNGVVKVFWAKMQYSDLPRSSLDGILRHPTATWIAQYDPVTLERLSFGKAPTSDARGTEPFSDFIVQYGFAVASDKRHTYLFGNANMLNLSRNGGHSNGPHPATRMYLARVAKGRFAAAPNFRTETGWSRDASQAVVVSERFWTENTMQPRRFGPGQWVSVTKENGFFGDELLIDVAEQPWGPWRTVDRFVYETRYGNDVGNSYGPVLMPRRDSNGNLTVVISQNAWDFKVSVNDPRHYRPGVLTVDWPFPD